MIFRYLGSLKIKLKQKLNYKPIIENCSKNFTKNKFEYFTRQQLKNIYVLKLIQLLAFFLVLIATIHLINH